MDAAEDDEPDVEVFWEFRVILDELVLDVKDELVEFSLLVFIKLFDKDLFLWLLMVTSSLDEHEDDEDDMDEEEKELVI
jgi:hypothetical protein